MTCEHKLLEIDMGPHGPHFAKLRCAQCEKFLAWVPDPRLSAKEPGAEKELRITPSGFSSLCYLLKQNDKCEERWKKPLDDFTKKEGLTEPQWKFFAAIHKGVLGTWPKQYYNNLEKKGSSSPTSSSNKDTFGSGSTPSSDDDILF